MGTQEDIREKVRAAGIVGAGGAGFPTHVKFNANAEIYLVNCAECEPLLKVDQQLAAVHAKQLVRGLEIGMQATGAKEGIIALKPKYETAIAALKPHLHSNMRLHLLKDVYPAGDEVVAIWMATGRRVPPARLPLDVGVVVNNVQTVLNVAKAVDEGKPVTRRTLTITGAVHKPVTVTVPIGVTYKELLDLAGGVAIKDPAFIDGGPMMGKYIADINQPIGKTTGGILVLPSDHILIKRRTTQPQLLTRVARTVCEQCRMCTEMCPRHIIGHNLQPHLLVRATNYNQVGEPSFISSALICSECSLCEAWSCPVGISPVRLNVELKGQLRQAGVKYTESIGEQDPMAEHRLVPVSRLAMRLNIMEYNRKAPLDETEYKPKRVALKLRQHIGAPSVPVVKVGDAVSEGQLVADIPDGALGVRLHASISGKVESIDSNIICISAE